MEPHCLKIIAHGLVQGVGFRYGTLQIANRLTITGTVQNLSDGTVKIIAEGNHPKLKLGQPHLPTLPTCGLRNYHPSIISFL